MTRCPEDLFESGLSGWSGITGGFSTTGLVLNNPGIVLGRQTIVPTTGWPYWSGPFDPHVGTLPIVNAGKQALLLGSDTPSVSTEGKAQSITHRFTASTPTFRFTYAVVLEHYAPHTPSEQPFFQVDFTFFVRLFFLIPIRTTIRKVVSGDPYLKTIQSGGRTIDYLPWDCYSIDLSPYQGQQVEVTFITAHCVYGPHFGYAYIDGFCDDSVFPSFTIPAVVCLSSLSLIADGSASQGETDYFWSVEESDAKGVGRPGTELGEWFSAAQAGSIDIFALYRSLGGVWKCNTYYRVKLAVKNHCVEKELVKVVFVSCPPVTAGPDACVSCSRNGAVTQLGVGNVADPGLTYLWSPSAGLNGASSPSPLHTQGTVAYPITYTVTVTDASDDCSNSDQVTLFCEPPTVDLEVVQDCCKVTLNAITGGGGYQSINWSKGPEALQSGVTSIVVVSPGTYTVTVANPCGIATKSVVVPAFSGLTGFFNPVAGNSLFTPGSGSALTTPADKLYIKDAIAGGGILGVPHAYNATEYKLEIFDRWGNLFKTITGQSCNGFPNWAIAWDGTDQAGNQVQQDVYSWILHFKNCQYTDWTLPNVRQLATRYCVSWFTLFGIKLWCTGYNVPAGGTTVDVVLTPQSVTVV